MEPFLGMINISENPLSDESFTLSLSPRAEGLGHDGFSVRSRADGGFLKASFDMYLSQEDAADFLENGLGKSVEVKSKNGTVIFEGYIYSISQDKGRAAYEHSLDKMGNAVWARYQKRNVDTEPQRSAVAVDTESIKKHGRKEFIVSCGYLESTDIADSIAQGFLDLMSWPMPTLKHITIGADLIEDAPLRVRCKGWFDTLDWCVYNQTAATNAQGVSSQIHDVVSDSDVGQFIASFDIETNALSVAKETNGDFRGAMIIKDLARVGDSLSHRWLARMIAGRKLVYREAAPPED